jgi:hypothetical protein
MPGGPVADIESADDLGRAHPHRQFAGDGVTAAEFVGAVGAHVARTGPGGEVERLRRILGHRGFSLFATLHPATNEYGRVGVVDTNDDT